MSTSNETLRSNLATPRSGEDLVLLPLDPDEVIPEEKPRGKRSYATRVAGTLVCVAMVAAYLCWDLVSPHKSVSQPSEPQPDSGKRADKAPQELDPPADGALPAPRPTTKASRSSRQASPSAEFLAGISSMAAETPRVSGRAGGPSAALNEPAEAASWIEREAPKRRVEAMVQPQPDMDRPSTRNALRPASPEQQENPAQLQPTKEMIAQLSGLISRGDFATAVNSAIKFRDKHPELPKMHGIEYRELLKLQRTATERYFGSQASSGRRPAYDTGDLDIAVIDHDLMTAYLQAAMPTFAREHFLNAEQGYDRALSTARQRERTASGGSSAKRDIQQITENLGVLYTSWAKYNPDASILRKADAAFFDSERLLDYAEDSLSAKKRIVGGKASIEQVRRRLP